MHMEGAVHFAVEDGVDGVGEQAAAEGDFGTFVIARAGESGHVQNIVGSDAHGRHISSQNSKLETLLIPITIRTVAGP